MSQPSSGSGYWGDPGAAPSAGDDPDRTLLRPDSPRRAAAEPSSAAAYASGPAGMDADDTRESPWPDPTGPRRAVGEQVGVAVGEDATRESPRPFEPAELDRTGRRPRPSGPAAPVGDDTAPRTGAAARSADPWQRQVPPPVVPAPATDDTLPSREWLGAPQGATHVLPGAASGPVRRARRAEPGPAAVPAQPGTGKASTGKSAAGKSGTSKSATGRSAGKRKPAKEQPDERPTSAKVLGLVREIGVIVVGALIITTLLRSFVFQPFEVPSGSMENTLQINDKIIAQRVLDFHRGDIVVFSDSNHWLDEGGTPSPGIVRKGLEFVGLLPDSSDEHLVKRVIGMPGDRVKCCDKLGRISVNGYPLDEDAYLYADSAGRNKPAEKPFEVVVPAGHIFVMGDHRANSGDSRCHLQDISANGGKPGSAAFIPVTDVVGSVTLIASPFSRFQRLATPQAFAGVPPPQQVPPPEPVIVQVSEGC